MPNIHCKFFKKNKCTKGNQCRFVHNVETLFVKHKLQIPISSIKEETELLNKIHVYTWDSYPRRTNYEIHGSSQYDIWSYYSIILKLYPENPYFTKAHPIIVYSNSEFDKKYVLYVSRSSTSD